MARCWKQKHGLCSCLPGQLFSFVAEWLREDLGPPVQRSAYIFERLLIHSLQEPSRSFVGGVPSQAISLTGPTRPYPLIRRAEGEGRVDVPITEFAPQEDLQHVPGGLGSMAEALSGPRLGEGIVSFNLHL